MIKWILCLVVFWNVENYFDPFTDPLTGYDEFTSGGSYSWTWDRFLKKKNNLAKILISCGVQEEETWEAPAIIGLCEIENRYVLSLLVNDSPLAPLQYGIIHRDSPDPRGIDVALLYLKARFLPLERAYYSLKEEDNHVVKTREILYVKGVLDDRDTLHLFVNHWPSKRGGVLAEGYRMFASNLLLHAVDSICRVSPQANIIVMGDFNDPPDSGPLRHLSGKGLINVSREATYKYRGVWECLDQFLVSSSVHKKIEYVKVLKNNYLLERDKTHLGYKP
ncbi:MAG: endonuclease/exonuclease/phosphatase family protein, partial [Bacteroidales bacterium]